MRTYIIRRVLLVIPTLFILSILVFLSVRFLPGDAIDAMLDKAEDPEKLIRLMITEMEDTLVEIKASCAGAMATKKRIERDCTTVETRATQWGEKAQLAVDKDREDLAREALVEKRRYAERAAGLRKHGILAHKTIGNLIHSINSFGAFK